MYVEKKGAVLSLALGLAITLLTYFLANTVVVGEFPYIRLVSVPTVGAEYWGYPLPWIKQIVYPGALKQVIWSHFVVNVVYWSILFLIVHRLYFRTLRAKGVIKKAEMKRMERALKPAIRAKTKIRTKRRKRKKRSKKTSKKRRKKTSSKKRKKKKAKRKKKK